MTDRLYRLTRHLRAGGRAILARRAGGRALPALRADRRAITALEYGIIASALAFVIVTAFRQLGTPVSQIFFNVSSSI